MKPPRFITGELFIRGPIPLWWMAAAGHLGGKVLLVALYLWHLVGLNDCLRVKLATRKLSDMGVTRQAVHRALTALEYHQLLLVERRPGCCPVVTLITRSLQSPTPLTARDLLHSVTPVAITFLLPIGVFKHEHNEHQPR